MFSGRYDFEDGGYYSGEYFEGVIEGHGVCVSPRAQGKFSGKWQRGFEISGVYKWPSGKVYEGCWSENKKHGLGVERRDRWIYKGEWTRGMIGRYGCKYSQTSNACYEGTWSTGLMDGYGVEVSADGGVYQGQWFKGMRHGHGVRASVPYEQAARYRSGKSLTFPSNKNIDSSLSSISSEPDESNSRDLKIESERGGFVLQGLTPRHVADSDSSNLSGNLAEDTRKSLFQKKIGSNFKRSLAKKFNKYRNSEKGDRSFSRSLPPSASGSPVRYTSGSVRSLVSADSNKSALTDRTGSQMSFVSQGDVLDASIIETYAGEWKGDKRCGYGIASRSDGLRYTGEWFNNKKNGYGMTVFVDGSLEEGKYKDNVIVSALTNKKASIFAIKTARLRDQVDSAVAEAEKASQIACQKIQVAMSRMNVARSKAEQASEAAEQARKDSEQAFQVSKKSWEVVIRDSDLSGSIQLRHSTTNEKNSEDAKISADKEPIGSSIIRHVLSSSFKKSLRFSQIRSSKHSDKPPEVRKPEILKQEEKVEREEKVSRPAVAPQNDPVPQHPQTNHNLPIHGYDAVDTHYFVSSPKTEPPVVSVAQSGPIERSGMKRNKMPSNAPAIKSTNIGPSLRLAASNFHRLDKMEPSPATNAPGKKSFKGRENLWWCMLVFFNILFAVAILFLLHRILV